MAYKPPKLDFNAFCGEQYWDPAIWNATIVPIVTQCFQHTTLVWIPTAIVFLLAPILTAQIFYRRPNPIPWTKRIRLKIGIACILIADSLSLFTIAIYEMLFQGFPFAVDFVYPLTLCLAMVVLTALIVSCRNYGIVTSGGFFISWLGFTLSAIPELMYWIQQIVAPEEAWNWLNYPRCIAFFIWIGCCTLQTYLHCYADLSPEGYKYLSSTRNPTPECSSSFFNRITMWWFNALCILGVKKPLEVTDMYSLNEADTSNSLDPKWFNLWEKQSEKFEENRNRRRADSHLSQGRRRTSSNDSTPLLHDQTNDDSGSVPTNQPILKLPSIIWTLFVMFKWDVITDMIVKFFSDILLFCNPMLLKSLIRFTEQLERPIWQGVALAFTMFILAELSFILCSRYFYLMYRVGNRVQTCLTAAVYRKILRLSNAARREKTVGEIVNLMAIDIDRFQQITPQTMQYWSNPFQIGLALLLLYQQLGVSVFSGVGVVVLLFPVNFVIAMIIRKWRIAQMYYKDERTKMVNEVLNGSKIIKLYAWEPPMEKVIGDLREKELQLIRKTAFLLTLSDMLNSVLPFLVAISTFATFIFIDPKNILTPEIAFVSLTLFNQLRFPMSQVAELITQTVQVIVSNRRLKEFLMSEKLNSNTIDLQARANNDVINVNNATFSWESAEHNAVPTLSNISHQSLVTIVGRVGAGKSSMLQALMGEMEKLSGSISMHGRLCYVPQQPWMQNNTLLQDTTFGKQFDEYFYSRVLDACALYRDLQILPLGDSTEIGEKGTNLSSGQKIRVSFDGAPFRMRAGGHSKREPEPAKSTRILRSMATKALSSAYEPISTAEFTEAWLTRNWFSPERLQKATKPGKLPTYTSNFLLFDKAWLDVSTLCSFLDRRINANKDFDYVDPSNFQSALAEQRVRRALQTKRNVLFPVISGLNHWIVMQFTEKKVIFYDPKLDPPKPDVELFLRSFPDMTVDYLVGKAVPKQLDGHSCGIFCCWMMLAMINNKVWTREEARRDVPTFRRKLREELETEYELKSEPSQFKNANPRLVPTPKPVSNTQAGSRTTANQQNPLQKASTDELKRKLSRRPTNSAFKPDSNRTLDDNDSSSIIELPREGNDSMLANNSISNRSDDFVFVTPSKAKEPTFDIRGNILKPTPIEKVQPVPVKSIVLAPSTGVSTSALNIDPTRNQPRHVNSAGSCLDSMANLSSQLSQNNMSNGNLPSSLIPELRSRLEPGNDFGNPMRPRPASSIGVQNNGMESVGNNVQRPFSVVNLPTAPVHQPTTIPCHVPTQAPVSNTQAGSRTTANQQNPLRSSAAREQCEQCKRTVELLLQYKPSSAKATTLPAAPSPVARRLSPTTTHGTLTSIARERPAPREQCEVCKQTVALLLQYKPTRSVSLPIVAKPAAVIEEKKANAPVQNTNVPLYNLTNSSNMYPLLSEYPNYGNGYQPYGYGINYNPGGYDGYQGYNPYLSGMGQLALTHNAMSSFPPQLPLPKEVSEPALSTAVIQPTRLPSSSTTTVNAAAQPTRNVSPPIVAKPAAVIEEKKANAPVQNTNVPLYNLTNSSNMYPLLSGYPNYGNGYQPYGYEMNYNPGGYDGYQGYNPYLSGMGQLALTHNAMSSFLPQLPLPKEGSEPALSTAVIQPTRLPSSSTTTVNAATQPTRNVSPPSAALVKPLPSEVTSGPSRPVSTNSLPLLCQMRISGPNPSKSVRPKRRPQELPVPLAKRQKIEKKYVLLGITLPSSLPAQKAQILQCLKHLGFVVHDSSCEVLGSLPMKCAIGEKMFSPCFCLDERTQTRMDRWLATHRAAIVHPSGWCQVIQYSDAYNYSFQLLSYLVYNLVNIQERKKLFTTFQYTSIVDLAELTKLVQSTPRAVVHVAYSQVNRVQKRNIRRGTSRNGLPLQFWPDNDNKEKQVDPQIQD